jgi:hypothetical protein
MKLFSRMFIFLKNASDLGVVCIYVIPATQDGRRISSSKPA